MAHFAELDGAGVVLRVIVFDGHGADGEAACAAFMAAAEGGEAGEWRQTSYTGSFRGRFAGIGFTYDAEADAFIVPPEPEETD